MKIAKVLVPVLVWVGLAIIVVGVIMGLIADASYLGSNPFSPPEPRVDIWAGGLSDLGRISSYRRQRHYWPFVWGFIALPRRCFSKETVKAMGGRMLARVANQAHSGMRRKPQPASVRFHAGAPSPRWDTSA